jgi:hypothetical protein
MSDWKCLNCVDWELLHEQSGHIENMIDLMNDEDDLEQRTALEGVLNLIDAMMDEAADKGVWQYPPWRNQSQREHG